MTHKRGRRNPKSQELRTQWQAARQFVSEQAFFDRLKGESICLVTVDDVTSHLTLKFEKSIPEAIPQIEHGLVLSNPSGQGAFQMIDPSPETLNRIA